MFLQQIQSLFLQEFRNRRGVPVHEQENEAAFQDIRERELLKGNSIIIIPLAFSDYLNNE